MVKKFSNQPKLFKASVKYFELIPYEKHKDLKNKLFNTPISEREATWNSFDIDFDEVVKRFREMTKERTLFAIQKGYSSKVEMALDFFGVPKTDYDNFVNSVDEVIVYCNKHLLNARELPDWFYSEFNIPCAFCNLADDFPIKDVDEAFTYLIAKNKILNTHKGKIKIKLGEESKTKVLGDHEGFEVVLNKKENSRHRILDLVHEISHVLSYLEGIAKHKRLEKSAYLREKWATRRELKILKSMALNIYQNIFVQYLVVIHRILFEIELYNNPDRDISKLYAKIFNRCFKGAFQKKNRLFVIDENIVLKPFSTLPHAISISETVLDIISKEKEVK